MSTGPPARRRRQGNPRRRFHAYDPRDDYYGPSPWHGGYYGPSPWYRGYYGGFPRRRRAGLLAPFVGAVGGAFFLGSLLGTGGKAGGLACAAAATNDPHAFLRSKLHGLELADAPLGNVVAAAWKTHGAATTSRLTHALLTHGREAEARAAAAPPPPGLHTGEVSTRVTFVVSDATRTDGAVRVDGVTRMPAHALHDEAVFRGFHGAVVEAHRTIATRLGVACGPADVYAAARVADAHAPLTFAKRGELLATHDGAGFNIVVGDAGALQHETLADPAVATLEHPPYGFVCLNTACQHASCDLVRAAVGTACASCDAGSPLNTNTNGGGGAAAKEEISGKLPDLDGDEDGGGEEDDAEKMLKPNEKLGPDERRAAILELTNLYGNADGADAKQEIREKLRLLMDEDGDELSLPPAEATAPPPLVEVAKKEIAEKMLELNEDLDPKKKKEVVLELIELNESAGEREIAEKLRELYGIGPPGLAGTGLAVRGAALATQAGSLAHLALTGAHKDAVVAALNTAAAAADDAVVVITTSACHARAGGAVAITTAARSAVDAYRRDQGGSLTGRKFVAALTTHARDNAIDVTPALDVSCPAFVFHDQTTFATCGCAGCGAPR